jgi:predicted small secreted protein
MKKSILKVAFLLAVCFVMTSCYTYTATVGRGPQSGITVQKQNIYLIYGLAPVSMANIKDMTAGAKDYEITVTHTFIDGLLMAITGGIFSPTTVIVKR